jgi:ubiquinone/menaquinone biosynthesis C-methylase UbiE
LSAESLDVDPVTLTSRYQETVTMPSGSYDTIADWYDEFVMSHPFYRDLVLPSLLELVGDIDGQRVCDIACGQGLATRQIAMRGAQVTGIDISRNQLALARQYEAEKPLGIDYVHDDAQTLATQPDSSFDGVACCMGLINIPDLGATFQSVRRVLKPGGWFVFCITHPCFEAPHAEWLEGDGRASRVIHSYFDEGYWQKSDPEMLRGKVGDWHRMVSTYVNTLININFTLECMLEPQGAAASASAKPGLDQIPNLLLIRAKAEQ